MHLITYTPGRWICLVRSGILAFLPPLTPAARVEKVWEVLGQGDGLAAPFKEVRAGYMEDLESLPSFALVSARRGVHVILRGPVEVQVGGVEEATVTGEGLTTWCERLIPGADSFVLRGTDSSADAGGAGGGPAESAELRLESGTVLASEVRATASTRGAASTRTDVPVPVSSDTVVPGSQPASSDTVMPETVIPETVVPEAVTPEPFSSDTVVPETVAPEPEPEPEPDHDLEPEREPGSGPAPDDVPAPPARSAPVAAATPQSTAQLIDSVPWLRAARTPSGTIPPAAAQPSSPSATPPMPSSPTAGRGEGAAEDTIAHPGVAREPGPETAGTGTADPEDGDTVMRSDLPARNKQAGSTPAPRDDRPATGPVVLARTCPAGHANPPTHSACSVCGAELVDEPASTRRPNLGTLRVSNGQVIPLDRGVVVGRQPSASRVQGGGIPRLLPIRSDSGDISRSHIEVRLEGWHVMLCDLNSTNGTVLIREGQLSRRLGRGETAIVLNGDVADLGDGVTLTFEGLV